MPKVGSEIKKEKFIIVIFDVLGFSSLMDKLGLDEIYKTYSKLINESIAGDTLWSRGFFNVGGRDAVAMFLESPVKYVNFSDSVLLWLTDFNPMTINVTFQKLNELICQSIELDFPLRGAISCGEAIINKENNIYLGEPIISAVRAESGQKWIGASLSHDWYFGFPVYPDTILPYEKHIKVGLEKNFSDIVLDFPRHWRNTRESSLIEKLEELKEKAKMENGPIEYYDTTIDFCKFSEKMHDIKWEVEYMEKKKKETPENNA